MPHNAIPELLPVRIAHRRAKPSRNAFSYGALYVFLPLSVVQSPPRRALFSFDRFNLFGFHSRDHGDGRGDLESWARETLARFGYDKANGDIELITLPRILGFAFNPVSFFLCRDRTGALRTVISEVNNTFGERHFYICGHDGGRAITSSDWLRANKIFHVSPFLPVSGHYLFRFDLTNDQVAIAIHYFENDTLVLSTSLGGRRERLSSGRLLRRFVANPLIPIKIIGLIHWQALSLFLKGLTYRTKPRPPDRDYSR